MGVLPKPYTADKLRHLVNWVVSRRGIPDGYSEGMPRPEPEPAKEKEKAERGNVNHEAAGSGSPEIDVPVLVNQNEGEPVGGVTPDVNGIVDGLSDLADFAVSHRGAGTELESEQAQSA